ncbi:MAG: hybrid sensor histidine kinase/response regulator [Blastochloris sp.]|nr:hybrid sensor histidine kinase/response regulator [Blastochloris sp.]
MPNKPIGQPATILVVDDIPSNQFVLERQLRHLGHRVLLADHGRAAIDRLSTEPVDLIMLDIMMPVMDGFETLAILKANPELRHLPVVIVSALNDIEDVARCINLGAEDFLFKPVDRVLLEARVEACLMRKRLHDREQEALAVAEAANRAKDVFVSMISHELRNPLSGITGYADMLLLDALGPLTSEQRESIDVIRKLTGLMTTLLADLTDLSRIETGNLRLEPASITLKAAVQAAEEAVRRQLIAKQHQISISLPADLPPVIADQTRLIQILTNLLSNASKYTPPGGTIGLSAAKSSGSAVEVTVHDTGIGIPADAHDQIFTPFFRTHAARNSGEPGTGLGLSITRRLVELQGGRISFTSQPGSGSTFTFTLPVAPSAVPSLK